MNYMGRSKEQGEINYIKYVMQMAGATEKQFVRAAVLHYCNHLMQRAEEYRQQELAKLKEKQDAANVNRDSPNEEPLQSIDNTTLANAQGSLDDNRTDDGA